jgi:hypothetical protein
MVHPVVSTIGAALGACVFLTSCATTDSDAPTTSPTEARVTDIRILTPGEVIVDFTVTHNATTATAVECVVSAGGSQNTVRIPDVAPNTVQRANTTVEVSGGSAEQVAETGAATVECSTG